MTLQRIGGLLLVAGGAGFGLLVLNALANAAFGGSTPFPVANAISLGSVAVLGIGAAIVAISRPPLPRAARAGFALIAVGQIGRASCRERV